MPPYNHRFVYLICFLFLCEYGLPASVLGKPKQWTNLMGYGGLLVIPTAYTADDGLLTFGCSRTSRFYVRSYGPYRRTVYSAGLGFLPFVEGTLSSIQTDHEPGAWGDRSFSLRINVIREGKRMPAITFGASDFLGVKFLAPSHAGYQTMSSAYMVVSKNFPSNRLVDFTVHFGYGFDWLPPHDKQLVGVFGGCEWQPFQPSSFFLEYDTHKINGGMRVDLLSHVQIMVGWWGFKEWNASIHYRFHIGNTD